MRVMQWIEGQFYKWEQYNVVPADSLASGVPEGASKAPRAPRRIIRLLHPERRTLRSSEAAALLSASLLWQRMMLKSNEQRLKETTPISVRRTPESSGPDPIQGDKE
jgi:hypothetical protein